MCPHDEQNEVAINYMKATNFMMLGSLLLGVCVEHSGVNFTNILRADFLFKSVLSNFYLISFWHCKYFAQENCKITC